MNALWNEITESAGVTLSPEQIRQLDGYLDLLIEKNKVLNLTRITDRAAAEIKHVADALTLLPHLPSPELPSSAPVLPLPAAKGKGKGRPPLPPGLHFADVGTGGGIPGVILAIARPDAVVTLIDATRKKLDAVKEMADAVGVTNVRIIHSRMDEVKLTFNAVTARGVADLKTLTNWCHALLRPGGVLLAMKGPKATEELAEAERSLRARKLTAEIIDVARPELPGHVIVKLKARA